MTKDEALKMAIEALEQAYSLAFKEIAGSPPDEVLFEDAIQACKEALEQPTMTYEDGFAHGYEAHRAEQALEQPTQEPVAWVKDSLICPENGYETTRTEEHPKNLGWTPLYTHPKEWQELSDDEIHSLNPHGYSAVMLDYKFARAIEQASKEKNI